MAGPHGHPWPVRTLLGGGAAKVPLASRGGRTSGRPRPPLGGGRAAARRGVDPRRAWGEARCAAFGRCVPLIAWA